MPADDTLKQLLDKVTAELDAARAELSRVVEAERAEAAARTREALDAERAQAIAQAEAAAEERGRTAGRVEGRETGLEQGREEGRREGRDAGREEGSQAAKEAIATSRRLVDAIRAIDGARSLTEILDALVASAGREAARAALFLVRGPQLHGWRSTGFEGVDNRFELPVAESGVIGEAINTAATASGDSRAAGSLPRFAELPPGRPVVAVPIRLSGQVIAVLYGDPGTAEFDSNPTWPASVEVLARYAARAIEATTAFRAAKVLTEPQDRASGNASSARQPGEPVDPVENVENVENVEDVQAAQRYARLLVSEIKLYHEAEVIAGRRERDLASRLGGEIARARVLYEQRVPAHIRRSGDHFHAELVRTLADGDASLLNLET